MNAISKTGVISIDHKLQVDVPADWPVGEVRVSVSVQPVAPGDSTKAIESLAALAALGGVKSINDPVEWQKTERQDRELSRGS
jgi:hypothetical protein